MEKRYQVFISSTFQDLQNARQEVSQALLRADCFPAGMELFPAADEEQFEFIKTIIDQSDYYILISAGRYGSIHPETGLSYTEMEYDYAVEIGKPIIRLLHKDPFNELKGEFIEKTAKGRKALEKFRSKVSNERLVSFWGSPEQLKAETVFALQDIQTRKPTVGWVKADRMSTTESQLTISKLEKEIAELQLANAQLPARSLDIQKSFTHVEGTVSIQIEKFIADELGFSVDDKLKNLDKTEIQFEKSEFCELLCAAMTNKFVQSEIVSSAINLWAIKQGIQFAREVFCNSWHSDIQSCFAKIRAKNIAQPTPVTGFTQPNRPEGALANLMTVSGPDFSQKIVWQLESNAVESASEYYFALTSEH